MQKMSVENICIFHLLLLVLVYCKFSSAQAMSMNAIDKMAQNEKIQSKLSRQRRYLIFPTGSSVQLVYEFTVSVPDYTLYVTTGITVALAWNLPDKPTYPEPGHNQRIGSDLSRIGNDTANLDDSVTMINEKLNTTDATKNDFVNLIASYADNYLKTRRPDSYYFGHKKNGGYSNYYYYSNGNQMSHYSRNENIAQYLNSTSPSMNPWPETSLNRIKTMKNTKPKPKIKKLHTIFPSLKLRYARKTSTKLSYEQKFYLDHHRRSRHQLYEIIEKYLFAKGYNGTECVLKTLCEVGRKQHETQPSSFLVEIVRAIFSLPQARLQNTKLKRHTDYDNAHQIPSNCTMNFPLCPENIWNAHFIIESDATIY